MRYRIQINSRGNFVIGYLPTYGDACRVALELSTLIKDLRLSVYREHGTRAGEWIEECFYANGE
jgi:hypothetical protein